MESRFSGKAHVEAGARVGSEVRALEEVSSLTPEKLAVISRYILFSRKSPPDSLALADLAGLDFSDLRLRKAGESSMVQLSLFELGRAPLNLDEIEDSMEVTWRGHDIRARVCAVRFKSAESAEKFWDSLRGGYEEKTDQSVHNSLGDGAHWYFRNRGASYCLWYRDRTLSAVMVRHDDRRPERDEWNQVEGLRDRLILELINLYDLANQ